MVPKETPWAPREALKDAKNVLRRSQKGPKGSLKGTKIHPRGVLGRSWGGILSPKLTQDELRIESH